MTFAIIETGAKQYKVQKGDVIEIEKLNGDFKAGDKVIFNSVILIDDQSKTEVGVPYLKDKTIEAKFLEEKKGKKVTSLRFKNKTNQNFGVKRGHRQTYSVIEIIKV